MKPIQTPRYAASGIAMAVVLLLAFFAYFLFTHRTWFDDMAPSEKVKFWSDFGVAYGTVALAIITVTSVVETQAVIRGEDLRFRQSRMPMVRVVNTYREKGGAFIALRNDGDGPAKNVRLSFDARTTLTWNNAGTAFDHDQTNETDVRRDNELCSSFMAVGKKGECAWTYDASREAIFAISASSSITYRRLEIRYEDVFGSQYVTEHDPNIGGEIIPFRFRWTAPADLAVSL